MGWDAYRRRVRIIAAIDLPEQTDRTIAQIAADVGFDSQSAFARAFRQAIGCAPMAYRNPGFEPVRDTDDRHG